MRGKDLKEYARHIPRRSISQEDADQLHLWSLGEWQGDNSARTVRYVEKEQATVIVEAPSNAPERKTLFHYIAELWVRLTGSKSRQAVRETQRLAISYERSTRPEHDQSNRESFRKSLFETARAHIAEIRASARQISELGDRRLRLCIEELADQMRGIVKLVEDDPRDMSLARPFLSVHFRSARDATVQFSKLYRESRSESLRKDYEDLTQELGKTLSDLRTKLLANDESDLAVEMEVLRERLKRSTTGT